MKSMLVVFACFLIPSVLVVGSCNSKNEIYDSACVLSYLQSYAINFDINPTEQKKIDTFLQSDLYKKVSDPRRRDMLKNAFETTQKVYSEKDPYQRGQKIAESMRSLFIFASISKLPGVPPMVNGAVAWEKYNKSLNELAERGKQLWTNY